MAVKIRGKWPLIMTFGAQKGMMESSVIVGSFDLTQIAIGFVPTK